MLDLSGKVAQLTGCQGQAVFLAPGEAVCVAGQILAMDGGSVMH